MYQITHQPSSLVFKIIGLSLLFGLSTPSFAKVKGNFNQCSESFYEKKSPTHGKERKKQDRYSLCFNGFAVMYSGQTRTGLWSAEYLTKSKLKKAKRIERENSFHSESRVPKKHQANLSHYSGSGYDRGHLAPNANMANKKEQYDSFSLANMVPQSPSMNRSVWKEIESDVRNLTKKYDRVYTITGALFESPKTGTKKNRLKNSVEIPSHMYKAVYITTSNQAGVYLAPNDESKQMQMISFDDFNKRTGINLMPSLAKEYTKVVNLPVADLEQLKSNVSKSNTDTKADNTQESSKSSTSTETDKTEDDKWLMKWAGAVVMWLIEKFVFSENAK